MRTLHLPLCGAVWLALASAHLALSLLAPRGVPADPLLPLWARASLLCTELTLLAAGVLAAAVPFALLSRAPAAFRPVAAPARWLLAVGLLLLGAGSWITFWLSGQFLNGDGIVFFASNLAPMYRYAVEMQPFHVYGLPWILLALAVAACELFPRWLRGRRPGGLRLLGRAFAGLAGMCAAGAIGGEVAQRFAHGRVTESATGVACSEGDLYRLRRDRRAGPLTHLAARLLAAPGELGDEAPGDAGPAVARRAVVPMAAWSAEADPTEINRWNVVVVVVDSLRADQLRPYGGARAVMPALEALAEKSRVFADCYTQASHTDYAAPCIFSSHYPLRARDVYRYPKDPTYPRVMIYDVLRALGWRTALFSSQNEDWGQMTRYLQTGGLDVLRHAGTRGRAALAGTDDDRVTVSEAIEWIDRGGGEPFFLALNLQNSHLPYAVPADFPRRFGPARIDFALTVGWFPEEKADVVRDIYADSLAYVDAQIDRLFGHLKARGLWDRTVVVVCADHGEAFYEHGYAAHANGVHEEVMRVPLLVRAPGLRPGREARPAQLIDVPPSLCALLGIPTHPSFQGEDLFGPEPEGDRTRFLLSDTPWSTQAAAVRSGYKLVHDPHLGRPVLYDLVRDPGERRDVSEESPEIARELRARLAAWRRAQLEYYGNPLRHGLEYPPLLER